MVLLAFISAKHAPMLERHQLHTFAQLWEHPIEWFEAPNERRGGWSGVGRLVLSNPDGTQLCLFVKKQQNHGRRTLRHPINGEPTFRRECQRLQFLSAHGFTAPSVVFYGEKIISHQDCAILVTEELEGYQPLDSITAEWFKAQTPQRSSRRNMLQRIAGALRYFHELGLVHRALYPKHIFIRNAQSVIQVALIDLEKARFSPLFWYRAYFDLAALNRHAEFWSATDRLYFFMHYCRIQRLNTVSKWFCRKLMKRARRSS